MTPERWQEVMKVLADVLEREPAKRPGYLDQVCVEPWLRREVESLIAAHEGAEKSPLERPDVEVGSSMHGRTLGHYRIIERVGEGGMGVVYRAHDEQLDRDVAIKILPAGALDDEAARKRFRREALALARLNHPNIETVYEFASQDGLDFLVMEYVPGLILADRVREGPLPEREVLHLAAQIAAALEEAHERGVVHRDLKPKNIAVTPKGRLKVLDFGLAKLLQPESEISTADATAGTGVAPGTLPYMSPEQLRAQPADARSDIYATGVVLYEMVTGKHPFPEKHGTALADDILHKPPPRPGLLRRDISSGLEKVILKCLEKEPHDRYQSATDLMGDLRRIAKSASAFTDELAGDLHIPRRWKARRTGGVIALSKTVDSLAVVPFVNLSGDPEMEYLSDGITDTLINSLSQLRKLRVVPRSLTFRYKGQEVDPLRIGSELNARAVLTGRVMQRGDALLIGTELMDVAKLSQLWGAQYNRKMADIFALQEEIAMEISEKLRLQLSGEEKRRLTKRDTRNKDAYQDYLRGRFWWNKRTAEGFRKGIEYFQQAIAKDSAYALAHSGLADCYSLFAMWGFVAPNQAFPKAKEAALRALQLDDTLAEAHASLGIVKTHYDWDWSGAERAYQQAIALNPSYTTAHQMYGLALALMGRWEEAIAQGKRAVELDPLSLPVNGTLGLIFIVVRQYDQAIEQARKTLELDPNFIFGRVVLAWALVQNSLYNEGIAECERILRVTSPVPSIVLALGYTHALAGNRAEALKVLNRLNELPKQEYVPALRVATIHAALGDKDKAIEWLQKAFDDRATWDLKAFSAFDLLRSDPRYADLLRRMNLQP